MAGDKHDTRRALIEAAAYELLVEKGYRATSMLAIAKRAAASNETLYRWYGSKQALMRALVEENAREVREILEGRAATQTDALVTLQTIGPLLLGVVTGQKAVTLNRAAVGDLAETATLGPTIAAAGRETIRPLIVSLLAKARAAGDLAFDDAEDVAEIYFGLLIGDLQIQRVIGVRDVLEPDEMRNRADRAFRLLLRLFGQHKRAR
jgi:AcrR family transcriptional regulator